MIVDLGDARTIPARRDPRGVEEQRTWCRVAPALRLGDAGNRDRPLPCGTARCLRHNAAANERKLAALRQYAAIAGGKATRTGAVDNDMRDGELAIKRFAVGLEIDAIGEATQLRIFGLYIRSCTHHVGEGSGTLRDDRRSWCHRGFDGRFNRGGNYWGPWGVLDVWLRCNRGNHLNGGLYGSNNSWLFETLGETRSCAGNNQRSSQDNGCGAGSL